MEAAYNKLVKYHYELINKTFLTFDETLRTKLIINFANLLFDC